MGWDYTDILKEHFMNPRNVMDISEEEFQADGVGEVGNVHCGDLMKMWIKIDSNEVITDCRWKTYGCASAIGSTSMLSEMVKGMALEEALKLTPEDIMEKLGGLPKEKIHCSVLGDKALRAAADDYFIRLNKIDRVSKPKEMACLCLSVSVEEIEDAVSHGAVTFEEVQSITKAGTGCGKCVNGIKKLIEQYRKRYGY
ncbi:MAG: iron-sulfur cluster assembly scaffold protein [Candidatus Wallbacteria bacterium HGW-Wallbacteria-1]|jgi:nitrogen fixation NifU-like protein|uniref:Iron-sulfur cluster assembly scaffold protein n=1 Tax=Candidatus Wallbacteria bacterium HGW-Wallbacteria-1 TaxID=2013854 RepID=A0A2N1PR08_9BACT|nr:MAG: iron-sulfur cluster assembly scaffold protein [Candidatus Wallbacteria bacterium HGW-Wallbacteria-1]